MSEAEENAVDEQKNARILVLFFYAMGGQFAGALILAVILILDIGNLRTLLWNSEILVLALIILIIFFSVTFAAIGLGFGVFKVFGKISIVED
ncbi:MAG: hypothetical protein JKY46_09680 [Robiginitomaculum sp.]|nr:hypothetical protein [Robiginitomaculum sp.]